MGLKYDITLLTDGRYRHPQPGNFYVENIFREEELLTAALLRRGCTVCRTHWDDPDFDWNNTRAAVFRTTWDYFHRYPEFLNWLYRAASHTQLINSPDLVLWNADKHYLLDLQQQGVHIPPTHLVETGYSGSLHEVVALCGWDELVLKPAVSGAGRHTYRFKADQAHQFDQVFRELVCHESVLLQEFQATVLQQGEAALMFFDGHYSHAALKKARPGDFRVQDDFGGTVHRYQPATADIELARKALAACHPPAVYARVDLLWDADAKPMVSELELIEPELWLRLHPPAAEAFADALLKAIAS